jgi:hypothetical protein
MAAGVEVVELISMETEGAIGCQVEGDDAYRCTSKDKRGYKAGMLPAGQRVQAERHRRRRWHERNAIASIRLDSG